MRRVRDRSDINRHSVLAWFGGGYDGAGRLLMTNIRAAIRRALKESLENPGRLPRGGVIGTGPWSIMCLPGRDESGISSGRSSRSRGSEVVKACSVTEDRGVCCEGGRGCRKEN